MAINPSFTIPMSSPDLTDLERDAVRKVMETPNLSMGKYLPDFEQAIAEFTGARYAVAVNSGTAGLHLCIRTANIQPGDLVLTTPFSFIASTNAILFEKAIPVFVDAEPRTGNIDVDLLEQAVRDLRAGGAAASRWLPRRGSQPGGRLKAILSVDVFGQPADYDRICKIAAENDLILIEDSCEALGAEYRGRKAGRFGAYGVFAFYPNKQITTGEGGIIVTDDPQAEQFMRALRSQGRAPDDTWLQHTYLGYNYRMDEMSAALGAAQMMRIEELLTRRERVAAWYNERLSKISGIELPVILPETTRMSWFVYVIRFENGIRRGAIARRLDDQGIPVRPYFSPIHLQPYMREMFDYREGDYPVTEDLGGRGVALPFSGVMTEAQVDTVTRTLASAMKENR